MTNQLPPPPEGIHPKQGSMPAPEGYYYIPPTTQYAHQWIPADNLNRVQPAYIPPNETRKQRKQRKQAEAQAEFKNVMNDVRKSFAALTFGKKIIVSVIVFFGIIILINVLSSAFSSSGNETPTSTPATSAPVSYPPNAPEHWFD